MNMKRTATFILFGILSYFTTIQAQSNQALIHIDKPYYVTGEMMWYQIYLPQSFASMDGYVKVIIKSETAVIGDYFIQIQDANLTGYFKIPYDIASDLYHLGVYVLEEGTQKPKEVLGFDIPIYNDIEGDFDSVSFPEAASINGVNVSNTSTISVVPTMTNVGTGKEVVLQIDMPSDQNGIMSISVVDESLIGASVEEHCVFYTDILLDFNTRLDIQDQVFHLGNITDAKTNQGVQVSIMGAYNHEKQTMDIGKSTEDGKFILRTSPYKGNQMAQIVGHLFDEHPDTRIEMYSGVDLDRSALASTTIYDDDVRAYIEASNIRKRIYQQYKTPQTPITYRKFAIEEKEDVKPNRSFRMSDYIDFKTMGEFVDEILAGQLSFNKVGEIYVAKMSDPNRKKSNAISELYYKINPVFIVDGKMTKNADFIYKLALDQIETLDLFFYKKDINKKYGIAGDFGYVIIKTKNGDLSVPKEDAEDIISYQGVLNSPVYPIALSKDIGSEVPKLRPSIYWDPKVKITGSQRISFQASDDISTYRATVVVRNNDGTMSTGTTTFEIELTK